VGGAGAELSVEEQLVELGFEHWEQGFEHSGFGVSLAVGVAEYHVVLAAASYVDFLILSPQHR